MTEHDSTSPQVRPLSLSVWAVASTVLAVISFFAPLVGLRGLLAVLAVVAGHAALHEIKNGLKSGRSFATAGLGLGYLAIVLTLIVIVLGNRA